MPGGGKETGQVGGNPRNHHREKLLQAYTHLHTAIHRCLGNQVNYSSPLRGGRDPFFWTRGRSPEETGAGRSEGPLLGPVPGLISLGAYRVKAHDSAGTGGADGETGVRRTGRIHGAVAVPGGAWDATLGDGSVASGGGSSAQGGPTSPKAAAPSATAPQGPGRRHLTQDGSRAGTWARAQSVGTRK